MDKERVAQRLLAFAENPGYLEKSGWLRSVEQGEAVDAHGRPIPWLTYPAIDFLAPRITAEMNVFEYGSGNSTFWWSSRVASLISCEHDKEFYAALRSHIPENTTYMLRRAKGGSKEYSQEILKYPALFDIIVLDGRDRVDCARNALGALRDGGVFVWDNSDREEEYRSGYQLLAETGFRRLDFWGMGALATRRWCTSIFYRNPNCLGI